MKESILAVILLAGAVTMTRGDLWWGNSGAISNSVGDLLPASETDPTVGAFAQLIRITLGDEPSPFVNSGSGVSGNDQVWHTLFAGQGDDMFELGIFPLTPGVFGEEDGNYFVRVFDAPQATTAAWDLGNAAPIPATAQYFFQSEVYSYTHNPFMPSDFDFAPQGGQTLSLVPEPGMLAFVLLSAVGMIYRRRRRRMAGEDCASSG